MGKRPGRLHNPPPQADLGDVMRTRSRAMTALLTLLAAAFAAPAVADAATVTVTGDDGNPIVLSPGAPVSIRHMDPDFSIALAGTERAFAATFSGRSRPSRAP